MTCYMVGGQRWNAFLVGSGWCLLFSLFVGSIIRVQSILGFRASWNSLWVGERETGRSGAKRSHVASQLVACESIATLLPHHHPPDPALQVRFFCFSVFFFFLGPFAKLSSHHFLLLN